MPYIVAFGSATPNKNIPRLIEAFTLARTRYGLPHRLVLIGHRAHTELAVNDSAVHFTGYVEEARLAELLSGAALLVFPSTYEGFGLPVVASDIGVLGEHTSFTGTPICCAPLATYIPFQMLFCTSRPTLKCACIWVSKPRNTFLLTIAEGVLDEWSLKPTRHCSIAGCLGRGEFQC